MNNNTLLKMNLLGGMDSYVREVIGDEDILNIWLMCGLPDGCDEDELQEIAEDDDCFRDIVHCFARCVRSDYS